jgi:ketosteroid isomerase-like protein
MESTQIVRGIYESFKRKDIPAVLGAIADDVEWQIGGDDSGIPFTGKRKGKEQVGQVFQALADTVEILSFEPGQVIAQGDQVVTEGLSRGKVRATGKEYVEEWLARATIQDGKVVSYRHYLDTAGILRAMQG